MKNKDLTAPILEFLVTLLLVAIVFGTAPLLAYLIAHVAAFALLCFAIYRLARAITS